MPNDRPGRPRRCRAQAARSRLRPGLARAVRRTRGLAIWALTRELERRHHVTRIYARACPSVGVVSVCLGVTVWCTGGQWLRWRVLGETVTWPASDPQGAAAELAPLARRPRQRSGQTPGGG